MGASDHTLARWRQQGFGVWWFTFVVIGYDQEFQIPAPGWWPEAYAQQRARIDLAKHLEVNIKFVIENEILRRKEGP